MVNNEKISKKFVSKDKSKFVFNIKNIIQEKFNIYKKTFIDTNNSIKNNTKLFYSAILFDIIFFLIYGFVNEAYRKFIQSHLEILNTIMMTAQGVDLKASQNIGTIILNEQTAPYLFKIIILSIMSIISTYLLFSFFIGISNSIRINIDKFDKEKLVIYLKYFYKNTAIWFFIYVIFNLTTLYVKFINTVRPRFNIAPTFFSNVLPYIGVILLYYFVTSFSYNTSKSFTLTLKNATKQIIRNGIIFIISVFTMNLLIIIMITFGMFANSILSIICLVILSIFISYFLIYYNKLQQN